MNNFMLRMARPRHDSRMAAMTRFACMFAAAFAACAALSGCSHSDYDSGDGSLSYLTADVVLLHTSSDKTVAVADMDDGTQLHMSSKFTTKWATTPDSVYRALLYYDRPSDGSATVRPRSVVQVPVLRPVKAADVSQIHADPLSVESVWMGKNRAYINISLLLKAGNAEADDAVQTVGLVDDGLATAADGTTVRRLRLYHDQGGVPEYYTVQRFVSIATADLGAADAVELTVNTYSGTVTKTIK